MKTSKTLSRTRALIALGMSAGLLISQPGIAATKPFTGVERSKKNTEEDEPAKKAKNANKTASSLNNECVRIYPDIIKRSMHVVAKENNGRMIDFFVFDLNGTIVHNVRMKQNDHIKITGLKRGKYIYRVFNGDEETANGQFEIR